MSVHSSVWRHAGLWAVRLALSVPVVAAATEFDIPVSSVDDPVKATLSATFTAGVGIRMQAQNPDLIGKADLNRNVCNTAPGTAGTIIYQDCQGVFRTQGYHPQSTRP